MTTPTHTDRRTVTCVGAATAFSLLGDQMLYAVLPVYYESLGLTALQVGIVLSANRWIRLLTNSLAYRIDGGRGWFVAAFVLGAATTAAYAVTGWFTVLLLARVLWGLAWSFIRHIGVMSIMSGSPRAGHTMGVYNGISRVGSVGGLLGGALLVDVMGFVPAVVLLGALSLLAAPLAWFGYRRPAERPATGAGDGASLRHLVLGFCIGAVGPGLVMSTLGVVLDARATEVLGLTAATYTGALLAIRFTLDSAVAPYLGSLTDRYRMARAAGTFFAAGAVALGVAAMSRSAVLVSAAVIAFFVCGTALQAGVAGTVSKRGPGAFARYVTSGDFGSAVGPLLGWIAFEATNLPWLGLAIGAVLFAGCALLAATGDREPDALPGSG